MLASAAQDHRTQGACAEKCNRLRASNRLQVPRPNNPPDAAAKASNRLSDEWLIRHPQAPHPCGQTWVPRILSDLAEYSLRCVVLDDQKYPDSGRWAAQILASLIFNPETGHDDPWHRRPAGWLLLKLSELGPPASPLVPQ